VSKITQLKRAQYAPQDASKQQTMSATNAARLAWLQYHSGCENKDRTPEEQRKSRPGQNACKANYIKHKRAPSVTRQFFNSRTLTEFP
jgi:hypothetical protein